MRIELKKFGRVLSSRSDGREAFLAIRPSLDPSVDMIEIDFEGIGSLGPGWADEFFTALKGFCKGKIVYLPTTNPSVEATLKFIEGQNKPR